MGARELLIVIIHDYYGGTKLFPNEVMFSHHTVNELVLGFNNNVLFDLTSISIKAGLPSIDNNGISPRTVVN